MAVREVRGWGRGLSHPSIPFGEGVTGQRIHHRPTLGVPSLITGA